MRHIEAIAFLLQTNKRHHEDQEAGANTEHLPRRLA